MSNNEPNLVPTQRPPIKDEQISTIPVKVGVVADNFFRHRFLPYPASCQMVFPESRRGKIPALYFCTFHFIPFILKYNLLIIK